jgi:hypothetical protein
MQVQLVEQFGIQREVTQYPWQVVELTLGLQVWFWSLTPATTTMNKKLGSHILLFAISLFKLVAFFWYQILSLSLMMDLMSAR